MSHPFNDDPKRRAARARGTRWLRGRLRTAGALLGAVALGAEVVRLLEGDGASSIGAANCLLACVGFALFAAVGLRALRDHVAAVAVGGGMLVALALAGRLLAAGPRTATFTVAAATIFLPAFAALVPLGWTRQLALAAVTCGVVAAGLFTAHVSAAAVEPGAFVLGLAAGVSVLVAHLAHSRDLESARRLERLRRLGRERRPTVATDERIAHLSHDLRNPLAVAIGYSDMAADDDLPEEERARALSRVKRSLWELTQMVENVLDSSAEEAGALVLAREPVEVSALCEDLCGAAEMLARGKPVVVRCLAEPGLTVLADRQRLQRVLGNLLGNAIKYTEQGEVALRVRRVADRVLFEVRDTGLGIAADTLPRIFDRYRQVGHGQGGVGLGLAISRVLTQRMGGSLNVESTLGQGSCFAVSLPLADAAEHVAA